MREVALIYTIEFLVALVCAFVVVILVEYFVHRAMHSGKFLLKKHAKHHHVQHENPDLVFWLQRPVHHLHHDRKMWKHNFGILVDVWDRVFGTYQQVEWQRQRPLREYPLSSYVKIKWF